MKPVTENLLRPPQIAELNREKEELEYKINGPWKHLIQKPGRLRQRKNEVEQQLARGVPEPLSGSEKDAVAKQELALREKITQGMLSQEEMRKNPPGAVDAHLKWERHNKADILKWKNLRLQLNADTSNPETWDREAANLERYRPAGTEGRVRLDAQIPGAMAMSPLAKENWPLGEPTVDTPLKQAKRRQMTDAQKAATGERLAKARAAKAARKAVTPDEQT